MRIWRIRIVNSNESKILAFTDEIWHVPGQIELGASVQLAVENASSCFALRLISREISLKELCARRSARELASASGDAVGTSERQ